MKSKIDIEFLQFSKEMEFYDLIDIDEKNIIKIKKTFFYKKWQLGKALEELAKAMRETKLGSIIISTIEFLDKCFDKIF